MKREVYENITKNFDVFEFLDKEDPANTLPNEKVAKPNSGVEGDDLSDELEFEIEDQDVYLNSDSLLREQRTGVNGNN